MIRMGGRTMMIALAVGTFATVLGTWQTAQAQSGHPLLGGPRGVVRLASGELLEGVMVQLIAQTTAIRTTVYSNDSGQYEFPKLDAGAYTLRIAKPLEHKP